ncbi:MAG: hypothetical protein QXU74_00555 [Candidatus Aenigmatarchaeota archaeon]
MREELKKQREEVIGSLVRAGCITSKNVENVMLKVKREDFVPPENKQDAYIDMPLPIPGGVTISAPHIT